MSLLEQDVNFLQERDFRYELTEESGVQCLVMIDWALPIGYSQSHSDLLIRLPAGYPDIAPDMWWFSPAITRPDGIAIDATQVSENYLGRTWQRWSRHLGPNQWATGIDDLRSFHSLVWREVCKAVKVVA